MARGERVANTGALHRAEARLAQSHYGGLVQRAEALRSALAELK